LYVTFGFFSENVANSQPWQNTDEAKRVCYGIVKQCAAGKKHLVLFI